MSLQNLAILGLTVLETFEPLSLWWTNDDEDTGVRRPLHKAKTKIGCQLPFDLEAIYRLQY